MEPSALRAFVVGIIALVTGLLSDWPIGPALAVVGAWLLGAARSAAQ